MSIVCNPTEPVKSDVEPDHLAARLALENQWFRQLIDELTKDRNRLAALAANLAVELETGR